MQNSHNLYAYKSNCLRHALLVLAHTLSGKTIEIMAAALGSVGKIQPTLQGQIYNGADAHAI